jgi:putative inorganic carbon (HCO3(-)) transporter
MNHPESSLPTTANKYPWQGHWLLIVTYCCLAIFFWLPHSYVRMVGWPWLVIWQLGLLSVGALLFWMLRQTHKPFQTLGYGLDWVLAMWAIAIFVSIIAAPVKQLSIWYAVMAGSYVGLLTVLRNWIGSQPDYLHRLWLGIVTVGLGTNLVSLFMWRPGLNMWQSADFFESVRNAMPLGHHNFVGGFEVLLLPLSLAFAFAWSGWRRWLGSLATGLAGIALYSSGSRGALLGAVVIVITVAVACIQTNQGRKKLWAFGAGVTAFTGVLLLALSNPRFQDLLSFFFNPKSDQANVIDALLRDGPILDRWQMLQTAGNIYQHKPLTGVGLGNMVRVFNLYRPSDSYLEHTQQLHNTPVQLVAETGLLGLFALLGGGVTLSWLWYRLSRQALTPENRWLLFGAGSSLLAYAVTSLTDYQLENIPIAALIAFNVVTLISLAVISSLGSPLSPVVVPVKTRQLFSLLVLIGVGLSLSFWVPTDFAALGQANGFRALNAENAVQADLAFDRASRLTPWDPIPSVLAANNLHRLAQSIAAEDQQVLQEQAAVYYQRALATAPNDAWFHYNLANILLATAPQQAEIHASRTVQLLPRETNYTYLLLGLTYFLQNQQPQAVDAFALETLADPQVVSLIAWNVPPLLSLAEDVALTSAELYGQLFEQLDLKLPQHRTVYEQGLLVQWWQGLPMVEYNSEALRPIVNALFLAESAPDAALGILNERAEAGKAGNNELLLRAWLKPEAYLGEYLEAADLPPQEVPTVGQGIQQNRELRAWLMSETVPPPRQGRAALAYAYRNRYATGAEELLQPEGLRLSKVADRLALFNPMPRVLPPLDALINSYRASQLQLPHPTESQFELTEISQNKP